MALRDEYTPLIALFRRQSYRLSHVVYPLLYEEGGLHRPLGSHTASGLNEGRGRALQDHERQKAQKGRRD